MRATALFRKKQLLYPPAISQNGGEKSIEYCQLKTATLAGEGQEVFVAAIFTLHAGKAVVQIAAIEISVNDLLKI
jgi:hypothetical protein